MRRIVGGALAGVVKMSVEWTKMVMRGSAPPAFKLAPSLKADAIPELPLKDVQLTSADGTKLHAVVDDGSMRVADRRPIVFVHGHPENWWSYHSQLEHFSAQGHPVLALSKRGYGASDKPEGIENYHMWDCLAKDVGAAVDFMTGPDGAKPLLVAHDFGAGISWAFCGEGVAAKEWSVAGFAALAVPPMELMRRNSKGGLAAIWAGLYMMFYNMPRAPEFVNCFNNAWVIGLTVNDTFTAKGDARARWINLYRTDKLQPGAMRAQLDYYRAMMQLGATPEMKNWLTASNPMELPVLLIRGKQDVALVRELYDGFEELFTSARLVELDACSHWIMADQPIAVNAEIEKFLTELE